MKSANVGERASGGGWNRKGMEREFHVRLCDGVRGGSLGLLCGRQVGLRLNWIQGE